MTAPEDTAILSEQPVHDRDTELFRCSDAGKTRLILKQRRRRQYFEVSEARAKIWTLCDGQRTVQEIAEFVAQSGGPKNSQIVASVIRKMASNGLVSLTDNIISLPPEERFGSTPSIAARCRDALTYKITVEDVDGIFARLYGAIGHLICGRLMRVLLAAVILSGLGVFMHAWLFRQHITPPTGAWFWLLPPFICGCTVIHEIAHALAVKHFRRDVIAIGLGWFWIGPFFFVDTSDMWLASRRQRIIVSLAGPMADLILAGGIALASLFLPPHLAGVARFGCAIRYLGIIFNLSPFLELDSYYALSDLLHRPNLRRNTFAWLFAEFQLSGDWIVRAIRRRPIECCYAMGSFLYLGFLLVMNALANHAFFKWLFRGSRHARFTEPLVLLITLSLLVVFTVSLISDLRRLRNLSQES